MNRCTLFICLFSVTLTCVSVALPYWIYRSGIPNRDAHYVEHFGLWSNCTGINTTTCTDLDGHNEAKYIAMRQIEVLAILGGMIALIASVLAACLTMTGPAFNLFGAILCLITVLLLLTGSALFLVIMNQRDFLKYIHVGFGLNAGGILGFVWTGARLFANRYRRTEEVVRE